MWRKTVASTSCFDTKSSGRSNSTDFSLCGQKCFMLSKVPMLQLKQKPNPRVQLEYFCHNYNEYCIWQLCGIKHCLISVVKLLLWIICATETFDMAWRRFTKMVLVSHHRQPCSQCPFILTGNESSVHKFKLASWRFGTSTNRVKQLNQSLRMLQRFRGVKRVKFKGCSKEVMYWHECFYLCKQQCL